MKRCVFWGALALLVTLPTLLPGEAAAARKKVVAVLPFTSPTRWNLMGRNAQEAFITQLVKTHKVRVVQASMVLRMLRRHGLHWTGVVEPRLLKAARRWLKADYIMAGKLRYTGDAYTLSVHVMDVSTLETTMADDVDFRNTSKMRVAVRVAARRIAGQVSGRGSGSDGKVGMFLNVSPRAFYDTSAACIRAMGRVVSRYRFRGSVEEADADTKTLKLKGRPRNLPKGVPIDIVSDSGIDGPKRLTVAYITRRIAGGYEARYRVEPDDGVDLGAMARNAQHRWVVAVGKIKDEAEGNKGLVRRFREALLEKMSEGDLFRRAEGGSTDLLADLSGRRRRFRAFRALFQRGVELVLEGKLYGSSGSRRAHFKIYSTLTGKVLGELKFETSL